MLSPLADPVYRRLFIAQAIALVGTGLATIALALLAYDLAGSDAGAVLGTALALKMVAYVGVAPVVGALAHRLPRRPLLVTLDLARAGLIACLPLVESVWQVYLLIFLLSACSAGFTPVFQAAIPDILPDEARYTKALSLSRLAYDLENLLSPTLAALLLTVAAYDTLFAANAVAFVVSATLVLSTKIPAAPRSEPPAGVWFDIGYGVRSYLATPRLRGLLLLSLAVAGAGAMVIVNTVVYVQANLAGSETQTAVVLAAAGAGSMVVALALPRLLDRVPQRPVMMTGGVLLAFGLALGLTQPGLAALSAIWFALGAGSSLVQTPTGLLLRMSCQPGDRSAFFSAQFALSHACWLIAYPVAGWLASGAGMLAAFAVLAAAAALATAAAARAWPAERTSELEHIHAKMEHKHPHVHDEHHRHEHQGWEGPEPHSHPHYHAPITHRHRFVIDYHHRRWPA
jgi:MFS family permease